MQRQPSQAWRARMPVSSPPPTPGHYWVRRCSASLRLASPKPASEWKNMATKCWSSTPLADELVGGVLSAGPDRLEAAGKKGVPQVVSLGALDMVNFGPMETVPEKFRHRNLYKHNPTVTLMRTTPEECAKLGKIIAQKLNMATGPVSLFIPLKGFSMIDTEGHPFYDPVADRMLIDNLTRELNDTVEVRELDMDINDPRFAHAMADRLLVYMEARSSHQSNPGGSR